MNSLFGKILLWFWCTLAITLVGSAFIAAQSARRNASDLESPAAHLLTFELEEARSAYETGGRPGLEAFLDTLERVYHAQGILADQNGCDLLTHKDETPLIRGAHRRPIFAFLGIGGTTVARRSEDGQYWFIFQVPGGSVGTWFLTPEHLFFLVAAVLLCYWLAYHLTSPVRSLQKAVERFGRGDLAARTGSTRRDELGQLARAFDRMAGRIGTLLDAERRLLLDISHELRSPLARLGVAVELARSGEDLDTALNRIQKESDRLNSLVGQLLEVTRAEGDPQALRRNVVRLDDLVGQVVEDSQIEAAAHECRLVYSNPGNVTVEGDPELLRRAVENVVRNAIRYSPHRSKVEVSLVCEAGTASIVVRDFGPGVPEEALSHLFDAFYRVDSDRDRASGGVGLGLSIARRAIEVHHGKIQARNADPGLQMTITLPVHG